MTCPYCHSLAELVTGEAIYPHRLDLYGKRFFLCRPCDAYVGCHKGTERPLGRLADAELRAWKIKAHAALDPLWQHWGMKRKEAYEWLAGELGIDVNDCHIGNMDVDLCKRVVEVCLNFSFA